MDDNLIPKPESNESGDETPADKKPGDKRPKKSKKNLGSTHGNGLAEPKSSLALGAIFFLIIEAVAFILWQIADSLAGYVGVFVHWSSLVCISIGPLPATREAVKRKKRWCLWLAYVIVWVLLMAIAYIIWRPPVESRPLKIGLLNSSTPSVVLELTNRSFFVKPYIKPIDFDTKTPFVFLPLRPKEPSILIKLFISNRSSSVIEEPQIFLVLPKNARFGMDPAWQKIGDAGSSANLAMQTSTFFWKSSKQLFFGDQDVSPDFGVSNAEPLYFGGHEAVMVLVRAKGMEPIQLRFWLAIAHAPDDATNMPKPQIIEGSQSHLLGNDRMYIDIKQ